jgi:hypothetical protein
MRSAKPFRMRFVTSPAYTSSNSMTRDGLLEEVMRTRLHSKYPVVAEQILASRRTVRNIVTAAARVAVRNAGLDPSLAGPAIAAIERGVPLDPGFRKRLQDLKRESDNTYLDAQDALGPTEALSPTALAAFRRARAIAALLGALDSTSSTQAAEVVYEALASSDDEEKALVTITKAT